MKKNIQPGTRRKMFGGVLTAAGVLNIITNISWLMNGDIHQVNPHVRMRDGWYGFWFSSILFSTLFVLGMYLLLTPEPPVRAAGQEPLNTAQKKMFRTVIFRLRTLTLAYGLVCAAYLYVVRYNIRPALVPVFLLLYLIMISGSCYWFRQRCPACGYRLIYANRLIMVTRKCPQCHISFQ